MITPERRRRAVVALTERFGVSERRACAAVGQHRPTQRRCPSPPGTGEAKLRRRLRQIAKGHPRWGWKKAHDVLRREGWALNAKRTRRLWRAEGLKRPVTCRKRRRLDPGTALRLEPSRPNEVWSGREDAGTRRVQVLEVDETDAEVVITVETTAQTLTDDMSRRIRRFGSQRGVSVASRSQLGLPA